MTIVAAAPPPADTVQQFPRTVSDMKRHVVFVESVLRHFSERASGRGSPSRMLLPPRPAAPLDRRDSDGVPDYGT